MYGEEKYPPMFKTVDQMRRISGLSKRQLYSMIHNGEVDYLKSGGRYLLTERDVWCWFEDNKFFVDPASVSYEDRVLRSQE